MTDHSTRIRHKVITIHLPLELVNRLDTIIDMQKSNRRAAIESLIRTFVEDVEKNATE